MARKRAAEVDPLWVIIVGIVLYVMGQSSNSQLFSSMGALIVLAGLIALLLGK